MATQRRRVSENGATQQTTHQEGDTPSLGELFNDLSADFSHLVSKEVELARTETLEKLQQARYSIILMVAAGLAGYAGFIALLIALADLLYTATGIYWLSSLIVSAAVLIGSAILYTAGRNALSNLRVTPEKTIETLKNDARWIKNQIP